MPTPSGLGDAPQGELERMRFEVPLPKTRGDIVSAFKSILEQGRVQRVAVELGRPIVYEQLVNRREEGVTSVGTLASAADSELYLEVRNSMMEELALQPGDTLYTLLLRAFAHVTDRSLSARGFLVHSEGVLRGALGLKGARLKHLYGVPVTSDKRVPEASLVLAAGPAESESVTFSLRLEMPPPRKEKKP